MPPVLPWVADFRDPWTTIFYRAKLPTTSVVSRFEKRLEASVVAEADAVIAVTKTDQAAFEEIRDADVRLISNGFDFSDLPNSVEVKTDEARRKRFRLSHIGVLNETRNPESVWSILEDIGSVVDVHLVGRIDDAIGDEVKRRIPTAIIEGNVAHGAAVGKMMDADLLLFVVNRGPGNESMIPAKIYEYLATGRPILGIGPVDGDAAELLRRTGSGKVFAYNDVAGAREFISRHFDAWKNGNPIQGCDPEIAKKFSRKELTRELADVLNAISVGR